MKRNHFHVFWDTYTAKQMSLDALQRFGVAVGNWEATADNPYTTTGAAAVRNRGKSTTICVTSGDRNHSVVDANLVACRDVRSLLPGSKVHRPAKRRAPASP